MQGKVGEKKIKQIQFRRELMCDREDCSQEFPRANVSCFM